MKALIFILALSLTACGRESSPEGRSQIRDEKLQTEIKKLHEQNKAILDSISLIRKDIEAMKRD